jgi:hypothetical protein
MTDEQTDRVGHGARRHIDRGVWAWPPRRGGGAALGLRGWVLKKQGLFRMAGEQSGESDLRLQAQAGDERRRVGPRRVKSGSSKAPSLPRVETLDWIWVPI